VRGRGLGRGRIARSEQRCGSFAYVGHWTGEDGKRHRRVLSTDRRTAERLLEDIIRRRDLVLEGLQADEVDVPSLPSLRKRYLTDLKARTSLAHYRTAADRLGRILDALGARSVKGRSPAAVTDYLQRRVAAGVAHRTANAELEVLRAMRNWGVRHRLLAANQRAGVRPLPATKRHQKRNRRALTELEVASLLQRSREQDEELGQRSLAARTIDGGTRGIAYAERERSARVPQTVLWWMLLETGARWSEAASLTWGDLDSGRETLRLRAESTKSQRERAIP